MGSPNPKDITFFSNHSGILPQRHQGTKIIELFFTIAFLMGGTLKLMRKSVIEFIFIFSLGLCAFVAE
jgi:hypothetical protein